MGQISHLNKGQIAWVKFDRWMGLSDLIGGPVGGSDLIVRWVRFNS